MNFKKTGKFVLAASAAALLLVAEDSQASIVWEGEFQSFTFNVIQNGAQFYQRNSLLDPWNPAFVPPTVGTSNVQQTAASYGQIVTTSPDEAPLASVFSMNAGAQGTGSSLSPSDGLSVKAFAEMTFTGFNDSMQGISGGYQVVNSSAARKLTVDAPGLYNFSANFSGDTDFDDYMTGYTDPYLGMPTTSKAEHTIAITARLTGFSVDLSGQITALADGTDLFFDLSEASRSENADLQLRTQTDEGDSIFYQMAIAISINAKLDNYTIMSTNTLPIETLDANGNGHMFLGTGSDPLTLNASLTPAVATPVPASALLLFSGLGGLAIFRRKARK